MMLKVHFGLHPPRVVGTLPVAFDWHDARVVVGESLLAAMGAAIGHIQISGSQQLARGDWLSSVLLIACYAALRAVHRFLSDTRRWR